MPYAFARRRREGKFHQVRIRVWRNGAEQCHATWRETRGAEEGNVFLLGLCFVSLPLPFIGPPQETNAVFQSSTDILCAYRVNLPADFAEWINGIRTQNAAGLAKIGLERTMLDIKSGSRAKT